MTYYRVSTWDADRDDGWKCVVARCRKWGLRKVLRRLYSQGWDTCSILVEAV